MEREATMSKRWILLFLVVPSIFAAGCNSDASATAAEEAAFKNRDKSNLKAPPSDAMQPPSNFKSSLSGSGDPNAKPPAQATPGGGG